MIKKNKQYKLLIIFFYLSLITNKVNSNILNHIWPNLITFGKTQINKKFFFDKNFDKSKWIKEESNYKTTKEPIITWLGHSTFLIQINGLNIITDPIFYDLFPLIYKRQMPLGISLEKLPKIDVVLISHNHKDHFDQSSLLELKKQNPIMLVPKGNKNWFIKKNFKNIFELKWKKNKKINNITFTFLKADHWTGTNLFNMNKSLAGSWMIHTNDITIYFAGDTAYSSHFKKIGKIFDNIDVALMPIAPTEPRKYIKKDHINPKEAIKGFLDLNAKIFIPMHWGTFTLGTDNFLDPINKLNKYIKKCINKNPEILNGKKLIIPKFGQKINFNNLENPKLS